MSRALLPREHGAYVQLVAPLVATFVAFGVTAASASLALAACLAFAAHEPLLVMRGHRGARAREADGARAKQRLVVLVPAASTAAIVGLVLAPPATVFVAAAVAMPATVLVALAWRRQVKTLGGEVLAAIVLSGSGAPIGVAAGARWQDAAWLSITWSVGYAFTVIAVHRVIARNRRAASSIDRVALGCAIAAAAACCVIGMWAAVPLVGSSAVLLVTPPPARYLRAVGFALVGTSVLSIVLVHALHV